MTSETGLVVINASITEIISDKGVCRTAPTTLRLLKKFFLVIDVLEGMAGYACQLQARVRAFFLGGGGDSSNSEHLPVSMKIGRMTKIHKL